MLRCRPRAFACAAFVCALALPLHVSVAALAPDELLLIANRNDPASMELARFYANARQVPDGHTLGLDLSGSEDVSFEEYETKIVPAVRAYLRERRLQNQVRCLVTFYGTPLRIGGKRTTPAEREELAALRSELESARRQLPPVVAGLEALAGEVSGGFKPEQGETLEQLGRRADAALRTVAEALRVAAPAEQGPIIVRLAKLVLDFTGPAKIAEMFNGPLPAGFDAPGKDPQWRRRVRQARERVDAL